VIGAGPFLDTGRIGERRQPDRAAPGHHFQPLRDQRPVQSRERHHVAHRAERHQVEIVEQLRLGPRGAPPAGPAQLAIGGDGEEECHADRRELAERSALVEPVRIDDGDGARQLRLGDMVVDDDDLEPDLRRVRERRMRGDAAIDRDHQRHALGFEAAQRRRVRPIALLHAIGDIEPERPARGLEEAVQQRRRGRAVDVVVAEHGDALAGLDGAGEPRGGDIHVLELRGVGQQRPQGPRRCPSPPAARARAGRRPTARLPAPRSWRIPLIRSLPFP
jgi:hypothetical protein